MSGLRWAILSLVFLAAAPAGFAADAAAPADPAAAERLAALQKESAQYAQQLTECRQERERVRAQSQAHRKATMEMRGALGKDNAELKDLQQKITAAEVALAQMKQDYNAKLMSTDIMKQRTTEHEELLKKLNAAEAKMQSIVNEKSRVDGAIKALQSTTTAAAPAADKPAAGAK